MITVPLDRAILKKSSVFHMQYFIQGRGGGFKIDVDWPSSLDNIGPHWGSLVIEVVIK